MMSTYALENKSLTTTTSKSEEQLGKRIREISALWGKPKMLQGTSGFDPRNYEYNDIFKLWENQEILIASKYIEAYLVNIQNGTVLKTITPRLSSDDMLWRTKRRQPNLQVFARVAEGAPFKTLTFKEMEFTDTVERRKLGVVIASGVRHDVKYGLTEFQLNLETLAYSAELTIDLEQVYGYMFIGFKNLVAETQDQKSLDWSKILNLAGDQFAVIALDRDLFLSHVERIKKKTIPGLDTIIIPPGVAMLFNGIGNSTVVQQSVILSQPGVVDSELQFGQRDGVSSLTSINGMNIFQLQDFAFNDKLRYQPLQSIAVIAKCFTMNPDITPMSHCESMNSLQNARKVYCMHTTYGELKVFHYDKYLLYCTQLFDHKHGGPSKHLYGYVDYKNKALVKGILPAKWELLKISCQQQGKEFDVNCDEYYDCEKPIPGTPITPDHAGFRDTSIGITYNPTTQKYYVSERIGDMPKEVLPNKWIEKCAIGLSNHLAFINPQFQLEKWIHEVKGFISRINEGVWTKNYILQLIKANLKKLEGSMDNIGFITGGKHERKHEREHNFGPITAVDWPPNKYGGMDLPEEDALLSFSTYPAGFGSAVGLKTIASKKDSGESQYKDIATEANRLITEGDLLVDYIKHNIHPDSALISEDFTKPWIVKCYSTQTLIDHLLPETVPVFIAITDIKSDDKPEKKFPLKKPSKYNDRIKVYEEIMKNPDIFMILTKEKDFIKTTDIQKVIDFFRKTFKKDYVPFTIFSKNFLLSIYMIDVLKMIEDFSVKNQSITKNLQEIWNNSVLKNDALLNINSKIVLEKYIRDLSVKDELLGKLYGHVLAIKENNKTVVASKAESLLEGKDIPKEYMDYVNAFLLYINDNNIFTDINSNKGPGPDEIIGEENEVKGKKTYLLKGTIRGYVRTSLIATPKLIEYIQYNGDGGILLGNPETNYNTPLMTEGSSYNIVVEHINKLSFSKINFGTSPLGVSWNMRSCTNKTEFQGINMNKKNEDIAMDEDSSSGEELKTSELFPTKTTIKSSAFKKLDTKKGQFSGIKPREYPYEFTSHGYSFDPSKVKKDRKEAFISAYPGPWDSNFKYYKHIGKDSIALLFLGIIEAPFNVETFYNVSKSGNHLIKVDLIRNAEEYEMYTVIVLKSGPDTVFMVYGRVVVQPSVDGISGAVTVSAEFFLGMIRRNPEFISLIPYAAPSRVLGGCDQTIMEDWSHFFDENPGRSSFIAVPLPACHITQEYPFHMLGHPLYKAPDSNLYGSMFRKYAAADWLEYNIGGEAISEYYSYSQTIDDIWTKERVSFVINKGCVSFVDGKGCWENIRPGTGPGGDPSMNHSVAYKAWNGVGAFPLYIPNPIKS